jgi:hypothetical protein
VNKTPERFVKVARSQLGVRFVPQGRAAYHALDCIGLPVVSAIASGFEPSYVSNYQLFSGYEEMLIDYLSKNCNEISLDVAQPGDMCAFWIMKQSRPRHLGILTETDNEEESVKYGLIHTTDSQGKVVEHDLDFKWTKHIHSVWRLKGMKLWGAK